MIYCPHCGSEVNEGSRYCSQCGQQIEGNQQKPIHKSEDPEKKKWLPIFIPTSVFLLLSAALFFVYTHEQRVNQNVIQSKQEAEDLALSGHFKEAEEKLRNAVDQRPNEEALASDLRSVQAALDVRKEMNQIESMIENDQLQEAEKQLEELEETIQGNDSQLFLTFVTETNSLNSKITVMKINQELNQMTNIDELASRLNELSGLNLKEAAQVREKVTEKMVSLSTEKAEKALSEKQYSEAISSVDQALQYVVNNQKLLQLKERIQQEKTAFENEQQQRLEQAMQQAAKDELKNQTDALEVVSAQVRKDEFGDYMVTGTVKSVATQIISTVTATYEVLNRNGEVVKTDHAKVYPIYLNPEDEGTFEKVYYDLKGDDYSVRVTEMEWLVE
ncbi:zinc-ribbon domain-containing protein [Halobacillus locisalis]|uniref:Zinc-ribbon domain-containing protein n=1 Tax=Halobacillus locisalis TaxID=220753 RepID=A0A838CR42_9BACI|nr:zinc-ribbon domain-containing protein [Halobacillus locisalis]MBA2174424.1 zinc-ribbon domain-containing protein [Halobacillus locisalis]